MLHHRRKTALPALDASLAVQFLLHRGAWMYVVSTRRVTVDKRIYRGWLPSKPKARCLLQIVLRGQMRLTRGGVTRWLGPGEASLQDGSIPDERWQGDDFEVLVVEWDPGLVGDPVTGWTTASLGARDTARLLRWSERLAGAEMAPSEASAHAALLCDLAASHGTGLLRPCPADLVDAQAARLQGTSRALGAALSELAQTPMLVDMERGTSLGERQVRRCIDAFCQSYGFPAAWGWRGMLGYWRLHVACSLMTLPGARAEDVAAAVGYGSARAFNLAMTQAGLPSPGSVRARVRDP